MQEKAQVLGRKSSEYRCAAEGQCFTKRGASDRRLDTCTGSPKGDMLVLREIDLLGRK